jgi:hypothetical protein
MTCWANEGAHADILTIYDVGQEGKCAYRVMELLDGETLAAASPIEARPRSAEDVRVQAYS